jgi:L-ascorbate metabolism protein UlaG (beta-lactamase superfamily)
MRITVIGHSTVLIESGGKKILTDPFFGTWGNPAYARRSPPAMKREDLANMDLVLVSHHHFDHIDRSFFQKLNRGTPVCAPKRMAWFTKLSGAGTVIGLKPWETRAFGALQVTAVPAIHWDISLGYVIRCEDQCVYFAGDTFFGGFMAEIGRQFSPDVGLLPVTTFRIPMTMGEEGAVKAVAALKIKSVIPIHLGLVPRSPLLRTGESVEGFERRLRAARNPARVVNLPDGEAFNL